VEVATKNTKQKTLGNAEFKMSTKGLRPQAKEALKKGGTLKSQKINVK